MKTLLCISILLWLALLLSLSCKKDLSCENCQQVNQPPIAVAGPDKVITLPADSIILDGSGSSDPEGTITVWGWTKISGPASFNFVNPTFATTVVKNLVAGSYQFELKVTDAGGLSEKDTVQVNVNDPSRPNQPPVANAGVDQTITLPASTVNLDGSGSTDPDNNITNYAWIKISGPSSFNITNTSATQTPVTNLVHGVYLFELKVTDAGGLFSKDTMQLTVNPVGNTSVCGGSRPQVIARLIPVGTLSQARAGMAVASAGDKIVFAGGGYVSGSAASSKVDIFDITSNSWTSADLSQAGWSIATAVVGSKIFFAGGGPGTGNVDIYDISTNTWSLDHLSEPRGLITGATVGNKVFFAGGTSNTWGYDANNKVDIYDLSSGSWSTATLSQGRFDLTGITVGTKIYFAGGSDMAANSLNTIDIYDNTTNKWTSSTLQFVGDGSTGIAVNDNIYWTGFSYNGQSNISKVEVRNVTTGTSSVHCLSYTRYMPGVALKNNKLVFFTGANIWGEAKNKFDIYDIATNTWSVGLLPVNIEGASLIALNNIIYVAGGLVNGTVSSQVWELEF